MPFISDREERTKKQEAVYDTGAIHADFSETFDAAVGFAMDEGLSTSRMLNNEMYETRRKRAKEIFTDGVSRGDFMDEKGRIDYNAMSKVHEGIKTDQDLNKEKQALLTDRRKYYNDVMERSESTAGNLLGSMTGYMMDPINVSTMAIATPFAVAKGVGVLGKALYGAAGAAAVNVATEALIQPFVLDYKLDIDSPYGAEDAITNIAMAAGGGFVLGGMAGGISGWLRKIRADADNIKLTPNTDVDELKVAVNQIDEMIDTLDQNPNKVDVVDEATHQQQVKSDEAFLKEGEAERTNLNRGPDEMEPMVKTEIDDADLEDVYRAIDEPAVIKDGQMVSAKEIIDGFDDDIAGLEAMRTCLLG